MKKRTVFVTCVVLICIVLAAGGGYTAYTYISDAREKKIALQLLSTAEYESVFFSMYDISTFSEEDFIDHIGIPVLKVDYRFRSATDINAGLAAIFSSGNPVTKIYIGLDPLTLWHSADKDITKISDTFTTGWFPLADEHPEVTFEVLFSFPSMDYWTSLEQKEVDASLLLCRRLVDILNTKNNIITSYAGGAEWLLGNPSNYLTEYTTNSLVSRELLLLCFCDHAFQITSTNADNMLTQAERLITAERTSPARYPDLSSWEIVFLGDSIAGNYSGTLSIPGVVSGLSGASTFNCAKGGASASDIIPENSCFPRMAEKFLSEHLEEPTDNFEKNIIKYNLADHSGKKLCFIINYGLNDYFNGYPVENPEAKYDSSTFAGAIRTGVKLLKENYPDAVYILMGPGDILLFSNGAEVLGGEGSPLAEYYHAAASLSMELDILYLDIRKDFPTGDDTLSDVLVSDGVHYNQYGRLLLGRKIVLFLEENLANGPSA